MAALHLRARPPCRFAWLLWIVMLLPIAQSAATWHAMWHTAQEASQSVDADGKHAPKPERCDLC